MCIDQRCYSKPPSVKLSWQDALDYCGQYGRTLARVDTEAITEALIEANYLGRWVITIRI